MNEKFKEIILSIRPEVFENPTVDLVEEGIIDSLDIMNIIDKCESEFGIDFDPEDVTPENFANTDAIWRLVEKCKAEK